MRLQTILILLLSSTVLADYPNLPNYNQIVDVGTFGGDYSAAYAINEHGQVVGGAQIETEEYRAFIWDSNVMTELSGQKSWASGINDNGQVVGEYVESEQYISCFWLDGELTTLPAFGEVSYATGVNNSGYIVGYSEGARLWKPPEPNGLIITIELCGDNGHATAINDSNQVVGHCDTDNRAFLWEDDITTNLGTLPSGGKSFAEDITNAGFIIGRALNSSNKMRAVIFDPNGNIDLGTLGGDMSEAYGANSNEQVVGWSKISDGSWHAFLWTQEYGMIDLNELLPESSGWTLNSAYDISDNSEVVGHGKKNGKTHGFVMIPESLTKHTLTIQADPANADSITPAVGEYEYYEGRYVDISAEPFANCDVDKSQYDFVEWTGAVEDPDSASTAVLMDGDKTITAVLAAIPKDCGDLCHPIEQGDLNEDCRINFEDFAIYSLLWLNCTHPDCD